MDLKYKPYLSCWCAYKVMTSRIKRKNIGNENERLPCPSSQEVLPHCLHHHSIHLQQSWKNRHCKRMMSFNDWLQARLRSYLDQPSSGLIVVRVIEWSIWFQAKHREFHSKDKWQESRGESNHSLLPKPSGPPNSLSLLIHIRSLFATLSSGGCYL